MPTDELRQVTPHAKRDGSFPEGTLFRWDVGPDTWIAIATEIAMIASYYTQSHLGPEQLLLRVALFTLFTNLFLNVLFPAYYVLRVRGEPLSELGITTRHWLASLALSVAIAAIQVPQLLANAEAQPTVRLLPHLLFNGIILWEVFFVYGWLQLRFERAFGALPAILLAGISFGAYHVGTYDWNGAVGLMVWAVFFAAAFRLTRSLLVLLPIAWAVGSSAGTLSGGMIFGWDAVLAYAVVLAIQVLGIAMMSRAQRSEASAQGAA